jgi:predicted ABC-type sugar transport system permease subunit
MMTNTLSPERITAANAKLAQASSRRSLLKSLTEPLSLLGALIVLVIIFSVLNPRFASLENLQNLLNQASLPLIIGIGATFVILIGSIDLSVEGVMAATGVTFVLMSANSRGGADLGIWAWLVPLALGTALGLASGLLYTKARIPSFLVTLGMWFVGLGIATVLYGTDAYPELSNDALTVWPATITLGLPNVFWVALVLMIIAAALFHKTALILLPLAALLKSRRNWVTLLGVSVFTVLAYVLFLAETYDALYEVYIYQQYASDGASIRIFMNAAAAITFIVFRKRYLMPEMQKHFWTLISFIALLFIPALMISPSSTAVDRVALYFMPLQLIAFSYFPFYFLSRTYKKLATLSVVGGFWLVMFVWFNYSNFYFAWLPYRFYPFE